MNAAVRAKIALEVEIEHFRQNLKRMERDPISFESSDVVRQQNQHLCSLHRILGFLEIGADESSGDMDTDIRDSKFIGKNFSPVAGDAV